MPLAVILCGGQGTRIRDVSEIVPKPMLPIGDRPIVWHIMKGFAAAGIREFVLCLGYKGWVIKEFFLNYRAMTADVRVSLGDHQSVRVLGPHDEEDWEVTLVETGEKTQTGGRVIRARPYLEGDDVFFLTYGDGVSDVDLRRLLGFHRSHGKAATVTAVRPPGRFGEVRVDGDAVTEFNERPQASAGLINGGFFVLDARRIWDYLGAGDDVVFELEPLRRLAADNQLVAYRHEGFWQPMDTLREYNLLSQLWSEGQAPWKTW
ncbi:MAG: glucose-1-phosphate cytidylyltransferase [Thermoanaerobaculia bacterium]